VKKRYGVVFVSVCPTNPFFANRILFLGDMVCAVVLRSEKFATTRPFCPPLSIYSFMN
jgi:hypothetical protein